MSSNFSVDHGLRVFDPQVMKFIGSGIRTREKVKASLEKVGIILVKEVTYNGIPAVYLSPLNLQIKGHFKCPG